MKMQISKAIPLLAFFFATGSEVAALEKTSNITIDPQSQEFQRLSDEIAAKEFSSLASDFGIQGLKGQSGPLSLSDVRQRFKEFLNATPNISSRGLLEGGALGLDVASFIKDVEDVFRTDTRTIDRIAMLTSVIPMAGCVSYAAAADESDKPVGDLSTKLCVFADALTLTPAAPLGVALQQLNNAVNELGFDPQGPINEFHTFPTQQRKRDQIWAEYIPRLQEYIDSDGFKTAVEAGLEYEAAVLIYAASVARGKLGAAKALTAKSSTADAEKPQAASDAILPEMCAAYSSRKQKLHEDYSRSMAARHFEQSQRFNDEYIKTFQNVSDALLPFTLGSQTTKTIATSDKLRANAIANSTLDGINAGATRRTGSILDQLFQKSPCARA